MKLVSGLASARYVENDEMVCVRVCVCVMSIINSYILVAYMAPKYHGGSNLIIII